jgi:hypothetical protein
MWAYWKLKPTVVCAAARAEHRNGFSISDRMHGNHVSACQHANWQALGFPLAAPIEAYKNRKGRTRHQTLTFGNVWQFTIA